MKREITEELYKMAEARIEELLPLVDDNTPTSAPRSVELCLMSDIVEEYEKIHYPISKPTFEDAIVTKLTATIGLLSKQAREVIDTK